MSFDPSKDIIRTDSGDPIPQIWNDEEQIFVPYEGKVQLSGSNVVLLETKNLEVAAGSSFTFWNNNYDEGYLYKEYRLYVRQSGNEVKIRRRWRWFGSFNLGAIAVDDIFNLYDDEFIKLEGEFETIEPIFEIKNEDVESRVYDIEIKGVI